MKIKKYNGTLNESKVKDAKITEAEEKGDGKVMTAEEAPTGIRAQMAKIEANEYIPWDASKAEVWNTLNTSLKTAYGQKIVQYRTNEAVNGYPNILFESAAGAGKSSIVKQWAKAAGVNLYLLSGSVLSAEDFGGVPYVDVADDKLSDDQRKERRDAIKKKMVAKLARTGILDQLDRPKSVLFLDELNRAKPDVQAALLQLVCDHIVQDIDTDGGQRYFPNFLFTVAAINPKNAIYRDVYALDLATKGRFKNRRWTYDKADTRKFLIQKFQQFEKILREEGEESEADKYKGCAAIADALLSNPDFNFDDVESELNSLDDDTWNGLATSPRNLELLLTQSNGTKEDVIKEWDSNCNSLHLPLVKNILGNYVDVIDKPNSVFSNRQTRSALFTNREKSGIEAIKGRYNVD